MRFWANLVGYQLVWFAAVIGAGRGSPWWGVVAAVVFVAAQGGTSPWRGSDVRVVAGALACGVVLDGGLALTGWLGYAAATPALLAPLWILALWAAFAMTINHSLGFLHGRPWLAAVFGAVGGPLAYLGAARGFAAVELVAPVPALVSLAAGWALALPLLVRLGRRRPLTIAPARTGWAR
ncbi:DUF2878 domain-containing protein [Novilysobacter erysipheiresistens]|uniref:DUF2878 domain-containing protein n=1 Tax=Novilysobacter erysipheiresistens TaxID=1749332 RepID=A0ABU7YXX3_9GAMM